MRDADSAKRHASRKSGYFKLTATRQARQHYANVTRAGLAPNGSKDLGQFVRHRPIWTRTQKNGRYTMFDLTNYFIAVYIG